MLSGADRLSPLTALKLLAAAAPRGARGRSGGLVCGPLQWPATGTQPGRPNWKVPMSGGPALAWMGRNEVRVDGSTTPVAVAPSPVQSPTTGTQPGRP